MCKKLRKSDKGFTLIELLAVIIILGVLMIIAIPSVTSYINDTRKSGYVSTIKELASGARNIVNDGKIKPYDTSVTYYMPGKCIPTENDNKSPYGEFAASYVIFNYNGNGFTYYWKGVDKNGMGIREAKLVDDIDNDDITADLPLSSVDYFVPIDGRTKIGVMNDACTEFTSENYTYRFTPQTTYGSTCTVDTGFTCDPSTYGQSYVSDCQANTYHFSTSSSRTSMSAGATCSGSGSSFECNSTNLGRSYTTASVQPQMTTSSTTTASSCTSSGSTACNQSTGSHTAYVCQSPIYNYYWGSSTTSTVSSCSAHTMTCNESAYNSSNPYYDTCNPNYTYAFGATTTSTVSSCTNNTVSCNESTYNSGNRTNVTCTAQYNYHLSSSTTSTVSSCSDTYSSATSQCNSTNGAAYVGKTYVRCVYNSSAGNYTKYTYTCQRSLSGYQKTSKTCNRSISGYTRTRRQCMRQISGYRQTIYQCNVWCVKYTYTCKKEYKITKQYCTR